MEFVILLLVSISCGIAAGEDDNPPCRDGWTFYQPGNKCVKVYGQKEEWQPARFSCNRVEASGRLLTIPDEGTQTFISELIGDISPAYWIGLTDMFKDRYFKWIDTNESRPCKYTNWYPGEPNHKEYENCGELTRGPAHLWNDYICNIKQAYICETQGPGCAHNNGGCAQICSDGVDGSWDVECSCGKGYTMHKGQCYDLDECSVNNGGCDYFCANSIGSYKCTCNIDYVYNGTHCVVEDGDILIG